MNRILRYRLSPIFAAVGLSCWSIQILSPVEATTAVMVTIASATWIIYPLDPILDPRDRNPGEGPRSWTAIRLLIAMILFVFAILDLRGETRLLAAIGLPVAICYAIPVGGRRLKDRSLTKIPFISLAVTVACVGIPWLQSNGDQPFQVAILFVTMFVLLCSNVLVCDLRDRQRDQLAGLQTLATESPATSLRIVRGLFMVICLLAWIGVLEPAAISMGQAVGLLLATVTLNIAARRSQQPIMTTLLADGSLILPALCGALIPG